MWQMKMRLLQAQFECRFSCCCSSCCLGLTTAGVTILTTCFPSPVQQQLQLQLKSVWQIVYDIMIMLMTLVMSCNCCAWSVPRFSSSSLCQSSLDWLHLSGQWDLYLCRVQWVGKVDSVVGFGLILWIVYGFQVCVDLCNHFMVTLCVRNVVGCRSSSQPTSNCPLSNYNGTTVTEVNATLQ